MNQTVYFGILVLKQTKRSQEKEKEKLSYIANILVVNDAKHPENEGKVFLFKFGKKIFDKITEAMKVEFEDEKTLSIHLISGKVQTSN